VDPELVRALSMASTFFLDDDDAALLAAQSFHMSATSLSSQDAIRVAVGRARRASSLASRQSVGTVASDAPVMDEDGAPQEQLSEPVGGGRVLSVVAEATETEVGKQQSESGGQSVAELDAAAELVQEIATATSKLRQPTSRIASRVQRLQSEVRQASAITTCSVDWSAVSAASFSSTEDGEDV
jgi:hypothetical protein